MLITHFFPLLFSFINCALIFIKYQYNETENKKILSLYELFYLPNYRLI